MRFIATISGVEINITVSLGRHENEKMRWPEKYGKRALKLEREGEPAATRRTREKRADKLEGGCEGVAVEGFFSWCNGDANTDGYTGATEIALS